MEVKTLLAFTYSCDLHFRFAFPWYSYSPTLKLRQLDISSDDKDWTRGKISLFMFTGEQGGGATMGKWEDGGGEDVSQNWEEGTLQRVVLCLKIGRFVDVALSHSLTASEGGGVSHCIAIHS